MKELLCFSEMVLRHQDSIVEIVNKLMLLLYLFKFMSSEKLWKSLQVSVEWQKKEKSFSCWEVYGLLINFRWFLWFKMEGFDVEIPSQLKLRHIRQIIVFLLQVFKPCLIFIAFRNCQIKLIVVNIKYISINSCLHS